MSVNHSTVVRAAADALKTALEAAEKAGYRILGQVRPAMLPAIGLSTTARVAEPAPAKAPEPGPTKV